MAQSQNREYESEKMTRKLEEVLTELQQKIFHHQLAPN